MVVAFHAGLPVPGGFVGVDVLFVISGFVITGMLGDIRPTHEGDTTRIWVSNNGLRPTPLRRQSGLEKSPLELLLY
jgi:hypothetical protein